MDHHEIVMVLLVSRSGVSEKSAVDVRDHMSELRKRPEYPLPRWTPTAL